MVGNVFSAFDTILELYNFHKMVSSMVDKDLQGAMSTYSSGQDLYTIAIQRHQDNMIALLYAIQVVL